VKPNARIMAKCDHVIIFPKNFLGSGVKIRWRCASLDGLLEPKLDECRRDFLPGAFRRRQPIND